MGPVYKGKGRQMERRAMKSTVVGDDVVVVVGGGGGGCGGGCCIAKTQTIKDGGWN